MIGWPPPEVELVWPVIEHAPEEVATTRQTIGDLFALARGGFLMVVLAFVLRGPMPEPAKFVPASDKVAVPADCRYP
jgi:hypothetical protein